MSEWKAVSLLAVVLVGTVQSTSRCHARKKDGSVCPRSTKVEIKFKPYYEIYFDKNGSTKSLYPRILAQASSQCCNSSSLDFISINSTEDIEELIKDESCDKEDHNQTNLTFFFPVFIQEGKKVAFDEEYQFVQLMKSSGPAVVMLKSEKGKMRVTASVAIRESWPLFALIISLSSTVGLLAWLMVCTSAICFMLLCTSVCFVNITCL